MGRFLGQVFASLVVAEFLSLSSAEMSLQTTQGQNSTDAIGLKIPLFKRTSLYTQSGVANMPIITRHLKQIDAKYKQGMVNLRVNTGDLDLWPESNSTSPNANASEVDVDATNESFASFTDQINRLGTSVSVPRNMSYLSTVRPSRRSPFNPSAVEKTAPVQIRKPSKVISRGQKSFRRHRTRQQDALIDEQNGLLWAGIVSIGSNDQSFLVDMDTGSADFWVPSIDCASSQCSPHKTYDYTSSSTSEEVDGKTFKITYGDGSGSSGPVYTDDISVAGVTAKNQYFSAVTSVSDTFGKDVEDGIMGLAFQSISEMNEPPVFQNLVNQNSVQSPMFSFRLAKTGSELFIGGSNPAKYSGSIEWHPLTSKSYWLVKGAPLVNNKPITSNQSKSFNMAIDSGTTVIVAPTSDAQAFWNNVPGSAPYAPNPSYYTFPCKTPPQVSFTFAGSARPWTISSSDFNLGQVSSGSLNCVGAVVGQDGIPAWILGDAFMKNVYSVFDMGQMRIGFAQPR